MRSLLESATWTQIDRCVGGELGALLGDTFTSACEPSSQIAHVSQISLTFAAGPAQVRLGLGVDDATCELLQAMLLGGDPSVEALDDALREMANTAAGAIKRAALEDGCDLTISLPSSIEVLPAEVPEGRAWLLRGESGIRISCVIIPVVVARHSISTDDLREGMVLSRDIVGPDGAVLASAGMTLTSTTVATLTRSLRANAKLDVSNMAA